MERVSIQNLFGIEDSKATLEQQLVSDDSFFFSITHSVEEYMDKSGCNNPKIIIVINMNHYQIFIAKKL